MAEMMTATATPDRAAIRSELEAMQSGYKELVAKIGDANWKTKSGISAWTCGQLAWHVAASVPFIAGNIESGTKGKGLNPPAFAMPILFKLSEVRVRIASRKATPASVLSDMDAGMTRLLAVLGATEPAKLAESVTSFRETRTIAEMFHTPVEHFAEHSEHIRSVLPR